MPRSRPTTAARKPLDFDARNDAPRRVGDDSDTRDLLDAPAAAAPGDDGVRLRQQDPSQPPLPVTHDDRAPETLIDEDDPDSPLDHRLRPADRGLREFDMNARAAPAASARAGTGRRTPDRRR